MLVDVRCWFTDIYPTFKEMNKLCKPGAGDDTCIFLIGSCEGFQCACKHGSLIPSHLYEGEGESKRQGCEFVKNIDTFKLGMGAHNLKVE